MRARARTHAHTRTHIYIHTYAREKTLQIIKFYYLLLFFHHYIKTRIHEMMFLNRIKQYTRIIFIYYVMIRYLNFNNRYLK